MIYSPREASTGIGAVQMAPGLGFFLIGLALSELFAAESGEDAVGVVKFSYSGSNGPERWGSLSPQFAMCRTGKTQSPIDIVTDSVVENRELRPLVGFYHSTNSTLINNGFNVGMKCNHDVGALNVEGQNYTLLQMHWHAPSEHRINGEQFPAELHLVHMSDRGEIAVVGVLFKYGSSDPLLLKLSYELGEIGREKREKHEEGQVEIEKINVEYLMKKSRKFYRYMGSLTTPPCSENVTWNILTKLKSISKQQVELLQAPLDPGYKRNCRPAQPLNGRKVELYRKSNDDDADD